MPLLPTDAYVGPKDRNYIMHRLLILMKSPISTWTGEDLAFFENNKSQARDLEATRHEWRLHAQPHLTKMAAPTDAEIRRSDTSSDRALRWKGRAYPMDARGNPVFPNQAQSIPPAQAQSGSPSYGNTGMTTQLRVRPKFGLAWIGIASLATVAGLAIYHGSRHEREAKIRDR